MPGGLALAGVAACFALSGFAALLYQTAWLRQLALVFGTSELAVATVLAAYMGGLAAGAAVAGRLVHRVRRPILVYGFLEAGIALSALCVPLLLRAASWLYVQALGGQPTPPDAAALGQPAFYLGVSFVVLAIPTGLMGATLPLLTRYAVRHDAQVGPRIALLYATNTAGAVLGTVATAFVLLPALGLTRTVLAGAGVNGLVFAIAALLARRADDVAAPDPAPALESQRRGGWILPLMLVSGATAFAYEVLWTRLLAHVLGGSVYAFATMLAAFLTGIALGSGAAGALAGSRERAAVAFGAAQVAIGLLSLGVYTWMGGWIPETRTTRELALYAALVMLPATVFIGATFPLAVRVLARNEREAGPASARVYAWNTVGAIAGALLAGFALIPALGFEGTIRLAVGVNLVLGVLGLALGGSGRRLPAAFVGAGAIAVLWTFQPSRPQVVVESTGFRVEASDSSSELYYGVGRSATVLLQSRGGFYQLRTNGLPEASVTPRGSPPIQDPEKWLTALPVIARPDAKSMLVVGFGGGVALEGVPPSVDEVDVVEIEPLVIEANRVLGELRERDPLADPRVNVVSNDARNALRLTQKRYDAIVSQPSHPWTGGASHLFTREFVHLAGQHLVPGGVFVQWMSAEFVTAPLLASLAATLRTEFEHVRLYHPATTVLIFVSSDAPLDLELALARSGRPLADHPEHFAGFGIRAVEDLLVALALDEAGVAALAEGAPLSTDDDNRMATQSRERADGLTVEDAAELFRPHDPLLQQGSWIHERLSPDLSYGYLANRLTGLDRSWRVEALADALDEPAASWVRAVAQFNAGEGEAMLASARAVLAADPTHAEASYLTLRDALHLLGSPEALREAAPKLDALPEPALAVIRGWQHFLGGQWPALAALDAQLAKVEVTDFWHPEAARLRAEWRLAMRDDRARHATEALRALDPALLLWTDANLYLLRANCALAAGDRAAFVESMHHVVDRTRRELEADAGGGAASARVAAIRQRLEVAIEELEVPFRAADERGRDVLASTRALLAQLDHLTEEGGGS